MFKLKVINPLSEEILVARYNEENFPFSAMKIEYLTKEEIFEKYNIEIKEQAE